MPSDRYSIRIRHAKLGERAALEELQRRASLANRLDVLNVLEHPEIIELPDWQLSSGRVLIAESPTRRLGFAVLLAPNKGDAELDGVFVEPVRWRQGVGSTLMNACVELARSEAAQRITAVVNTHAEAFYKACGFGPNGRAATRFGPALHMSLVV